MAQAVVSAERLSPALAAWRAWDLAPPLQAPPRLGLQTAQGSGHAIFEIDEWPVRSLWLVIPRVVIKDHIAIVERFLVGPRQLVLLVEPILEYPGLRFGWSIRV